jgi:glycosyltransferase involved in cell wall biosynthesis
MFSIIIATHDSERALVPTLAALVPGATAGLVREVIVADGSSHDETEQVADIAGCRFLASDEPLGARLKSAAGTARADWLMFLHPGVVPGLTWIDETARFVEQTADRARAAVFSAGPGLASLRRFAGLLPRPQQGLMIRKSLYEELGGHRGDAGSSETDLLRRIGRRRLVTLRATVTVTSI